MWLCVSLGSQLSIFLSQSSFLPHPFLNPSHGPKTYLWFPFGQGQQAQ